MGFYGFIIHLQELKNIKKQMADTTPISFTIQARDWEGLMGIISFSPDAPLQELLFSLNTYVRNAQVKPAGNTPVTIVTTEYVVTRLAAFMYGNTVMHILNDLSANMFTRVMAAVRAANNTADNYIATTLAAADAANQATALQIRKNGRQVIMMAQYDGN